MFERKENYWIIVVLLFIFTRKKFLYFKDFCIFVLMLIPSALVIITFLTFIYVLS